METSLTPVKNVLTRTTGYLKSVTSHSLQPYRGCPLGRSLCGVGCYVQHNHYVTRGRRWGSFLEVRHNAAESYLANVGRERRWARRSRGEFSVFLSSSTEPFPPQEFRHGITRRVLEAMLDEAPDCLVLQTHSHRVAEYLELYRRLDRVCSLRVHVSIETDLDQLPGLPRHASPVKARFEAAARLKAAGLTTVVTVSPLLPMADPGAFFRRVKQVADAVVLDHFIGGDGTRDGRRTWASALPEAMARFDPRSVELEYRDTLVEMAMEYLPGRVGVGPDGFAGRYLPSGQEFPRPS